jgi:C-terminal processing protease CtpA/Prc
MDAIFPFLFGEETALIRGDTREDAARRGGMINAPTYRRVEGRPGIITQEHFARPHPSEHRLFDARVFVLTSGFTGSAAEHFALALKSTGRGTLIGATTGGAGNFALGGPQPLNERFTAFVPIGRSYDLRTGRGWEGTGVDPDIAVPAERALVEALVRAGVAPAEAERLSASVHPAGSMERLRPRTAG